MLFIYLLQHYLHIIYFYSIPSRYHFNILSPRSSHFIFKELNAVRRHLIRIIVYECLISRRHQRHLKNYNFAQSFPHFTILQASNVDFCHGFEILNSKKKAINYKISQLLYYYFSGFGSLGHGCILAKSQSP